MKRARSSSTCLRTGLAAAMLTASVAVLGAGSTSATAPPDSSDEQPFAGERLSMSYAWFPALHSISLFVADKAGFWDEEGLDVELTRVDSGANGYTLLLGDQVNMANAGLDVDVQAYEQGREIRHIYPLVNRVSMNLIVSNDVIEEFGVSPDDPLEDRLAVLPDLTFGYTSPNAPTDIYARDLLALAGVEGDVSDQLVALESGANMVAALEAGSIDAFMLTPPTPNAAEAAGIGTVLIAGSRGDVPSWNDYPYSGVSAAANWLATPEGTEASARFVTGLLRANELIRTDPDQALEYVAEYFPDLDDEVLQSSLDDMIPSLPESPYITQEQVEQVLAQLGDPDAPSDEGVLWTNEIVAIASDRLAD